ncbi:acyl carrier protein [Ihubacter sp. rT4E-8]|uniref:acyl carrier protein n=1 Tax=Ihubacter sp. rT4E-8 TaxID=3242369 RepID=UPI003CEB0513
MIVRNKTRESIRKKILQIIKENSDKDYSIEFLSTCDLDRERVFDSISFVNFVISIESEFGIRFGDAELLVENMNNIEKICDLILELMETKNE